MTNQRPEPTELLQQLQDRSASCVDSASRSRGRLKVFFGMAPGVGKTYAMLEAARRLATQGVDVAVGVVETHGRAETERLLLGLDVLPRRVATHQGTALHEFDLDAALARRPDVLLIDELAHTNTPSTSPGREKRWQDVGACLAVGIDVWTTLNVQHLESLNDVVAQITGITVRETVPDRIFDEADEIELVDLPPDALHERLKAGKVYIAESAARALDPDAGFFRKGNLSALRELSLRRTAAWVSSDLRRYKRGAGIRKLWPTSERMVVAISPSPMSAKLIRAAKRMAAGLHAELIAVYVEPSRAAPLSSADSQRLQAHMRLAESLGATTATLTGESAADELIAFAKARDVSRLVVGKTDRPRWRDALFGSFTDRVIRASGDIDVYVVRGDDAGAPPAESPADAVRPPSSSSRARQSTLARSVVALLLVAGVTAVGHLLFAGLDLANIVMVYLAAVVLSALWLGRTPAIVAAVAGVAAFDFFFVEPRLTFNVREVQYLLTFGVMLTVGLIVGTLAARSRERAEETAERERRTSALYALSRELAAARTVGDVAVAVTRHAHDVSHAGAVLVSREPSAGSLDVLAAAGSPDWFDDRERAVAQWALDHHKPAGLGTSTLPASAGRYLPLGSDARRPAVLGIHSRADASERMPDSLLDAIAAQTASSFERIALADAHHAARLDAERERLRSALLSSVSHDLRTPLASITGAATALQSDAPSLDDATRGSLIDTIITESSRLSDIIANLIFATRLDAGGISLRREWTTVEEIVGVGLSRHRHALASRTLHMLLPADLPMLRVDNAMLPQVIHNLIENALRYTPASASITIAAWTADDQLVVKVADNGPGLGDDEASRVFQRFYRGRSAQVDLGDTRPNQSSTGLGLGLTICEGIVRAHAGRIWTERNSPTGVAFLFSLPIDHPQPSLPKELGAAESGS